MNIEKKALVKDYYLPFIGDRGFDPGNEFQIIYLPLRETLFSIVRFYFGIKAKSEIGMLKAAVSSRLINSPAMILGNNFKFARGCPLPPSCGY